MFSIVKKSTLDKLEKELKTSNNEVLQITSLIHYLIGGHACVHEDYIYKKAGSFDLCLATKQPLRVYKCYYHHNKEDGSFNWRFDLLVDSDIPIEVLNQLTVD